MPLSEAVFSSVIKACFNVGLETKVSDVSRISKNKLLQINKSIETEIQLEGATLWGLFNGITRFTNHVATTKDRQSYLMTGAGYDTNVTGYNEIMKWVEARTEGVTLEGVLN